LDVFLGWGIILSKKNLVRCATLIRDSCPMCHILRCHDQPVILSACLISMETHPSLTVLPESLELGEIRGTQPPNTNTTTIPSGGQVLDDVSVTHILTLPTSASVQVRIEGRFLSNIFLLINVACSNNAST
jgi:hypothetical protein